MGKKVIPEFRFNGYTDDWEERKLGELGSVSMNKRIFKEQTTETGDVPFFKIGTFGSKPDAFISRALFEEYKSKYPYPEIGDILISASGSIGRLVVYQGEDEYFQDSNIVWLKHDNRLNNKFLKQFYLIVKWQGLEGSTIKRLYNKNILETYISIPDPDEQEKIGNFFKQLDDTIALHQRELELLNQSKKSYLQKMFPKIGEKVPEIRFAGFTDAWKERKLKDYVGPVISDGDWIEKEHIHDSGVYRIIQTGNLGLGEFHDKSSSAKYMNEESFNILNANEIFPNDILISRLADPAGRTTILPDTKNKMVTAVDVTIIRPNKLFDSYFFITEMNSTVVLNKISKSVSGTSHKRISRKNLELISLLIPSLEEQQKIGSFFKQLDDAIALHQRKLESLKELKKGYLQKMFL